MSENDPANESTNSEIQKFIEDSRKALDTLHAKQSEVNETSKLVQVDRASIAAALEGATKAVAEINTVLTNAKAARDEALSTLEKAKTDSAKTSEIARIADEKDERVSEYEKTLEELTDEYRKLKTKITELLPEATGVGLAKSFSARKEALKWPMIGYLVLFIVSIIGFLLFGLWALFAKDITTIEDFFKFALERSPIIVGLILLEEFARRQFHSITKLEEDYAYKASISIAFDGYKKAMMDIDGGDVDSLAKDLSKNVIETLNQRPGRLIDVDDRASVSANAVIAGLSVKNQSDTNPIDFINILRSNMKSVILRNSVMILLALSIGVLIGFYFSNKDTPLIDSEITIQGPLKSGEGDKKEK